MPRTSRKKRPSRRATSKVRRNLRKQIRTTSEEWGRWADLASKLGHAGVSPWLRYIANSEVARATAEAGGRVEGSAMAKIED